MMTALLRNAHYHFHPGNHAEVFGSEIFPSDIYGLGNRVRFRNKAEFFSRMESAPGLINSPENVNKPIQPFSQYTTRN